MEKNRIFRRVVSMVALGLIMALPFVACGKKQETKTGANATKRISIVCTTFPQYDWTRQIIKGKEDKFDLILLQDNGVDLHSYQPTAEDIMKVGQADLFIHVGGESDGWVEDALKEKTNKNLKVLNMVQTLGGDVKEEEVKEGMEAEEEGEEEEPEYDEHVWLSLKFAKTLTQKISDEVVSLDPEDKEILEKNTADYIAQLDALDQEYQKAVDASSTKTLLYGDRFPFRYMVEDYNLDYYAAFVGCSAESEASFKTITFLSSKVDELKLKAVCVIETSDKKIAKSVVDNTKDKNQEILVMDSLQSVSEEELKGEKTYLSVMTGNLEALKKALQ